MPLFVALVAILLTLPGLSVGWQTDDHLHRATMTDEFPVMASARHPFWDMFAFVKDGMLEEDGILERGELPWWTPPNYRIAFFRPVAGITHWLDYNLWPHSPWIMHAHSIAWYGLTVFLAALLFRRISIAPIAAGLAALIYAISDGHGLPAVWLANRNATIAVFFGICTLIAYDRWRRDGFKLGAVIAPIALLAAVLANEGAVSAGAYLLAYAIFMDPDRTWKRFPALLPCVAIGVGWWLAYRACGYGAIGSGVYIDPANSPLEYLMACLWRGPILIFGLFCVPPSDAHIMLSNAAYRIFWGVSIAVILLGAIVVAKHVKANKHLQFALMGMLLSILPPCATFASDRLLMFAGVGAAMLIAHLIVTAWQPSATIKTARIFGGVLIVVHLVFAPIGLLTASQNVRNFGETSSIAGLSLPHDDKVADQRIIAVSAPSSFLFAFAKIYAATQKRTVPDKTLALGSGVFEVHVHRPDDESLLVTQDGGWLALPGQSPEDDFSWVGSHYLFQTFDVLFRDDQPFEVGQRIEFSDCAIEIVEITPDDRPAKVRFEFAKPLEDDSYRWVYWKDNGFTEFKLPPINGSVTLPAPRPPIGSMGGSDE